jgi:glucosamine 6-phosphate synthetase-like amidotransferase/phosphosugar isomerase protein
MCGVYGFVGIPTTKTARVLGMLAVLNEDRGQDSAGMAFISENSIDIVKNTGTSERLLLEHKPLQHLWHNAKNSPVTVIGHTRAATTGAVTQENAHPFNYEGIVYAHNGMISNHETLCDKLDYDCAVDSQVIGPLLLKYAPEIAYSKHLAGSYAIPWVDTRGDILLNFTRHISPLAFTTRPDKRQFYYSSDTQDLKLALEYAGYKLPVNTSADGRIYSLTWEHGALKMTKRDYTPRAYVYSYTYPKTYSAYNGGYRWDVSAGDWSKPVGAYERVIENGAVILRDKV